MVAKLLKISKHEENDADTVIFEPKHPSKEFYVIVRGTVRIEEPHPRYKNIAGMPMFVKCTCYDGDQFGETIHFTSKIDELSYEKDGSGDMDREMKEKIEAMMNNRLYHLR